MKGVEVRGMRWLLVGILFLLFGEVKASHMACGQITYQNVGTDSFLVTVKVCRYCSGAPFNPNSITISATSTCGGSLTAVLPKIGGPVYGGIDISQVCSSDSSDCVGGTVNGYVELTFQGIVVISPRCDCWTLSYTTPCCRNNLVNASSPAIAVDTKLCNTSGPTNSSPIFGVTPIPYVCAGIPVSYNMGVTDPDGDSLTYQFICAQPNLVYNAPYSCQNPINGITLDTATGQINFTATITGAYVVVVQINEYDSAGNLVGSTVRDVQFRVETCSNTPPVDTLGITNYWGVGYVDTTNSLIEVCLGDSFSFDVTIWDHYVYREDTLDTLLIQSNVDSVLPGATFSINAINDSVHVVTIGWRAVSTGSLTNSFFIYTSDDACPIPGFTTSDYIVRVIPATEAGPNRVLCEGVDTASINVIGGTSVTWRVLNGDPIVYGTNFECDTNAQDTCMRARLKPAYTTTYEVNSNLGFGCKTIDTVTVIVVTDFNTITTDDTTICFSDSTIQINVATDTALGFSYKWTPGGSKLDNDTSSSPFVTPIFSTSYYVTVTSDSGCVKKDTVNVFVTPPFPPNISAFSDNPLSCPGIPTGLGVNLGNNPQTCGLSTTACPGALDYYTSLSTTNTNSATGTGPGAFPAPYGGSNRSARHQFLFRQSELSALGISSGMIESIGFNVVANTGSAVYQNFSIKMGCTSDTALTGWHSGLHQVYTPKNTSIVTGWNTHLFDQNLNYDGSSNLVIEICFDNVTGTPSSSAQTAYTATAFNSCISNYSNSSTCSSGNIAWGSQQNRPNIKFSYCGAPDSLAYSYQWTPANILNFDTLKSPVAIVNNETTFKVLVTDTFGLCHDSAFTTVSVVSAQAGPDTTVCAGDTIVLRASGNVTCSGQPLYAWDNGQYLDDDSTQFPKAVVYQTTQFVATVYDTCGCVLRDTLTISVNPMDAPNGLQVEPNCNAADGEITVQINGGWAPLAYSIDTGASYAIGNHFTSLVQGYYGYQVIDSLGCVSETTYDTLLMKGAPWIDSAIVTDVSCYEFTDGSIHVYADPRGGVIPLEYSADSGVTWNVNNPITGLRSGSYDVIARSATGCMSLPVEVEIIQPTKLVLNVDTVGPDLCYQLGMGQVQVHGSGGISPYRYQWSNGSANALNDSLLAGTYYLNLLDDNQCVVSDSFEILEPQRLQIIQLKEQAVSCFGYDDGRILIKANGGYDLGIPLRSQKGDSIPYYEFSIDAGFNWQGPDLFNTNDSSSFEKLKTGTYGIVVRDQAGCETFASIDITEPSPVTIVASAEKDTVCIGTCTELNAQAAGGNSGGYTYHWTPNLPQLSKVQVCPDENKSYLVYATDSKNCVSTSKTINVVLFDSLRLEISDELFICQGSSGEVWAKGYGGDGQYSYEWKPFIGISNPFDASTSVSPNETTEFVVELKDACGSPSVTAKVNVNVLKDPVVDFAGVELSGCEPHTVEFKDNSLLTGANCYWVFGDDTVYSCGEVDYEFEFAGVYDVSLFVETEDGCRGSKTIPALVKVHPKPLASFELSPNPTTFLNTVITAVDRSEGEVVSWSWNFADLGKSTDRNTTFEFPEDTGEFPIRLEVTSAYGCVDDSLQNLMIGAEYLFYVPSSFTPNGDGINDGWRPEGVGIDDDQYELFVFDRWGQVLWQTSDFEAIWDGVNPKNGTIVQQGTYTWKIVTGDTKNRKERHEYFGTVTVIR